GAQEVGFKPAGRRTTGARRADSGKGGPPSEDEAAVHAVSRRSRSNRTQKGLYHTVMGPKSLPRRDHPRISSDSIRLNRGTQTPETASAPAGRQSAAAAFVPHAAAADD